MSKPRSQKYAELLVIGRVWLLIVWMENFDLSDHDSRKPFLLTIDLVWDPKSPQKKTGEHSAVCVRKLNFEKLEDFNTMTSRGEEKQPGCARFKCKHTCPFFHWPHLKLLMYPKMLSSRARSRQLCALSWLKVVNDVALHKPLHWGARRWDNDQSEFLSKFQRGKELMRCRSAWAVVSTYWGLTVLRNLKVIELV